MWLCYHTEVSVEGILVGLVEAEIVVEQTTNHSDLVLMIFGVDGCAFKKFEFSFRGKRNLSLS